MAFHEVQFPPGISYGAVGGPGFHTTILTLVSGYEQRNIDWSLARGKWDVAQGLKSQDDLNVLLKFFYARQGKAFGFRFKDWSDFQVPFPGDPLPTLGVTNGTQSVFQIVKTYTDVDQVTSATYTYTRPILKPVAGTFQLFNNGVLSVDYSIDITTGLVTLGATTRATTGRTLTFDVQFDTPVRFDTDDMKVSFLDYNNYSWNQIPLVELRSGD